MSTLERILEERAGLPTDATSRVQALISDWQILSDLAFADLLLCVRDPSTTEIVVAAQMRPYTAQTVHQEDLVGTTLAWASQAAILRAFEEGYVLVAIFRTASCWRSISWGGSTPVWSK